MMARRRKSWTAKFLRKHPILVAAPVLGGGAGYGVDRWVYDASDRTQFYVSAAIAVLVLIGKLTLGIGYGAIYVIDGWLPEYDYQRQGCIYVGKTTQYPPDKRIEQHLHGSTRYGSAAQPWADTVTGWRLAHESRYMTTVGLHVRELVNIRVRRPRYNYMMNMGNGRRVPKYTAVEQRAWRDEMRWVA